MMQTMLVAVIVGLALAHVVWTLAPGRLRRAVATWLLRRASSAPRHPWGRRWRATLEHHSRPSAGCGCSGCDAAPPPGKPQVATVRLVRHSPARKSL